MQLVLDPEPQEELREGVGAHVEVERSVERDAVRLRRVAIERMETSTLRVKIAGWLCLLAYQRWPFCKQGRLDNLPGTLQIRVVRILVPQKYALIAFDLLDKAERGEFTIKSDILDQP